MSRTSSVKWGPHYDDIWLLLPLFEYDSTVNTLLECTMISQVRDTPDCFISDPICFFFYFLKWLCPGEGGCTGSCSKFSPIKFHKLGYYRLVPPWTYRQVKVPNTPDNKRLVWYDKVEGRGLGPKTYSFSGSVMQNQLEHTSRFSSGVICQLPWRVIVTAIYHFAQQNPAKRFHKKKIKFLVFQFQNDLKNS